MSDAGQVSRFAGLSRERTISSFLPITKAGGADIMGRLLFALTAGRRFL